MRPDSLYLFILQTVWLELIYSLHGCVWKHYLLTVINWELIFLNIFQVEIKFKNVFHSSWWIFFCSEWTCFCWLQSLKSESSFHCGTKSCTQIRKTSTYTSLFSIPVNCNSWQSQFFPSHRIFYNVMIISSHFSKGSRICHIRFKIVALLTLSRKQVWR